MTKIEAAWEAWPLALVLTTQAADSAGATRALLERARNELDNVGARVTKDTEPTSYQFASKWMNWRTRWMQYLSGEVRVEPTGDRLVVRIRTNLVGLLASSAAFGLIAVLVGVPLWLGLAMIVFLVGGNSAFAFFSIRGMLARIVEPFPLGAA